MDLNIVLAGNAVFEHTDHIQCTASPDGQVIVAVKGGVGAGVAVGIVLSVFQGVDRSFLGGNEQLICAVAINGRTVGVGNAHII